MDSKYQETASYWETTDPLDQVQDLLETGKVPEVVRKCTDYMDAMRRAAKAISLYHEIKLDYINMIGEQTFDTYMNAERIGELPLGEQFMQAAMLNEYAHRIMDTLKATPVPTGNELHLAMAARIIAREQREYQDFFKYQERYTPY